ncbi:MAG: tetratricopeptide repeat protein [Planctomycetota bacterium]
MVDVSETMEVAVQRHHAGRLDQAEQLCRMVLQSDPNHPAALHLLGVIAYQAGKHDVAVDLIGKAIRNDPQVPQFHNNIGVVFKVLGKFEEAVAAYEQAVLLKPDYVEAYNNMGNALQSQGRYADAVEKYKQVVLLKPDYAEAYNNMGIALQMQGRYAEAVESCARTIRLKPDYAEAYNTMASALQMQGRHAEAIENYRQTLRLKPDYAAAHINLGMALLLSGKFAEGWNEYEWRWKTNSNTATYPRHYEMPRWDGSPSVDKRLFIQCEQGLGDNLQFVRYLPMVKARGGTVIFEVRKSLLGLLRGLPGVDELVEASFDVKPAVKFDFYASLLDLPRIFGTTLGTIPADVPYIRADPAKSEHWRSKLAGPDFKVGIVWAGKPTHKNDLNRSSVLKYFAPLAGIPGVQLYGLQKGHAARQVEKLSDKMTVTNLAEQFDDFADTAAVIDNLDLVVSVDTAALHLAGAMGKPVWTLLPFTPDWRWMLDRQDSPWYPTMKLFRQRRPGDWDDVFHRVAEKLQTLVDKQAIKVGSSMNNEGY